MQVTVTPIPLGPVFVPVSGDPSPLTLVVLLVPGILTLITMLYFISQVIGRRADVTTAKLAAETALETEEKTLKLEREKRELARDVAYDTLTARGIDSLAASGRSEVLATEAVAKANATEVQNGILRDEIKRLGEVNTKRDEGDAKREEASKSVIDSLNKRIDELQGEIRELKEALKISEKEKGDLREERDEAVAEKNQPSAAIPQIQLAQPGQTGVPTVVAPVTVIAPEVKEDKDVKK